MSEPMDNDELIAREQIRDVIAHYAHAADAGDFHALAALFLPDGILEIVGQEPLIGRDAIIDFLTRVRERRSRSARAGFVRHHVSSLRIEIGSEAAAVQSYFLVIGKNGPHHSGRYEDRLRCRDGRWLFERRVVRVEWMKVRGRLAK